MYDCGQLDFTNKRIGNLEVRKVTNWLKEDSKYIEFIKWHPNIYYGRESEYIWDDKREQYKDPKCNWWYIDKSCFKHPESCYVIAFLDTFEEEPDIQTVGSRPFKLDIDEYVIFRDLVNYTFEQLGKE